MSIFVTLSPHSVLSGISTSVSAIAQAVGPGGAASITADSLSAMHVYVTNASIDEDTESWAVIEEEHNQIHNGNMYTADWYPGDLTNTASANVVFEAVGKEAHMLYEVVAEMECHFSLYEGVTYAASGTSITPINKNRVSASSATAFIHHTPTTPSLSSATLLRIRHFGSGGTPAGKSDIGGGNRSENEFIFKPSTKYLLQINNQSGASGWAITHLNWYEI